MAEALSRTTTAVVFAHGYLGFSRIGVPGFGLDYFKGARRLAKDIGIKAYFPAVPTAGSILRRADRLGRFLERKVGEDSIIIIAHSMGGLDARQVIHCLDPDKRIHALVTLSTPNLGSPVADWVMTTQGWFQWTMRTFFHDGVADLQTKRLTHFNACTPNRPDVRYLSYGAMRAEHEVLSIFRPLHRVMTNKVGASDIVVSPDSAKWGEYQDTLEADHLELIGIWSGRANERIGRPFDHLGLYRKIIDELLPA